MKKGEVRRLRRDSERIQARSRAFVFVVWIKIYGLNTTIKGHLQYVCTVKRLES